MDRSFLLSLLALTIPSTCYACSAGSGEYQIIQNPTMTFNISPPISWTFYPAINADAGNTVWYFVGQSNNSMEASNLAQAQISAAMTQALVNANLPIIGVNISSIFTPIAVANPMALTTGLGPLYGKVEANALAQTAVGGTGVTVFVWQPYSQYCTVTVRPLSTTLYNWNLVKNMFMQNLQLNYYARFATDITITGDNSG